MFSNIYNDTFGIYQVLFPFFIYFEPTDRNAFCTLYSVKICIILVVFGANSGG